MSNIKIEIGVDKIEDKEEYHILMVKEENNRVVLQGTLTPRQIERLISMLLISVAKVNHVPEELLLLDLVECIKEIKEDEGLLMLDIDRGALERNRKQREEGK